MTDDEATKLVTLFFGIERNGVREKGLVDHEDEESFDKTSCLVGNQKGKNQISFGNHEALHPEANKNGCWSWGSTKQMDKQCVGVSPQCFERRSWK